MKPIQVKELLKILRQHGCEEVRQEGLAPDRAVREVHGGARDPRKDVAPGTLRNIRDTLEPCLGKGWIK